MGKFYGKIGFSETRETSPGIWTELVNEKNYYGDVLKSSKYWRTGTGANDNIEITHRISVLSDPYISGNLHNIRYAEYMGCLWKVTDIETEYPRVTLTLGGVYNG